MKEQILKELKNKSEVINDSLWYVNPDDIKEAISKTREETIKEMEWEIENWEIVDGKSFTSDKIKDILNKLKK